MIEIIFIIALSVLFLHVTTWEGMIFSFVRQELKTLPDYIKKPLFDCPICMCPWWGALILFAGIYTGTWQVYNWFEVVIILFAAAGVNTVLIYIVDAGKSVTKTLNGYDCNCTEKLSEGEKAEARQQRIKNHIKK